MNAFKNIRSLAGLNKYLWKYKLMLFWGMLFVIVSNFFAVVPAQIVRHSIDLLRDSLSLHRLSEGFTAQEVLESHVFKIIFFYALIILGMALMKGLFMFMMRQTIIVMSRKVEYDLKNEIYSHFQDLSLAFYRRNNTGDLMARITEDVSRVRMYLGPAIMYTINLVSLIILVITIMLSVNVELTLLVLLPLPILAVTIYYVNNITYEKSMGIQGQLSKLTTYVQEVFSGIRVVKSFAAEESVKDHFAGDVASYREKTLGLVKVESLFFPTIIFLIGLSTLITLYFGGIEVMEGSITPGVIAEFFIYVSLLSWPVAAIGWTTNLIQRAAASQARINELLKEKPDITDMGGKEISVEGHVAFENVSFTYPETGIEALRDINLNIRPGESLGIIGRTGSGKSTFANLLLRAYDATSGKVLIDENDLRELDLGVYHEQVGYVPQDDFLFSVSIADNILFGLNAEARKISKEKTTELLHWAAEVADVSKDVKDFPKGFETMLGERGITLSGGQKQRVAIARAIVHNPKLLILDDCFSAIDTNTEAVILQNLSEVMKGKTSIIISHRVSTVKNATHVIVLDNGQIVEQGNHDTLMQKEGYYYMLYKKQLMEKELYERQKNTIG